MRKFTLFCVLLFFAVLAVLVIFFPIEVHGQTDNTIHVKSYPGTTLGAKITAAMVNCPPASAGPCILLVDPSLAHMAAGSWSLCGNCYLWDYRSGPPTGLNLPGVSSNGQGLNSAGPVNATGLTDAYTPTYYTWPLSAGVGGATDEGAKLAQIGVNMDAVPTQGWTAVSAGANFPGTIQTMSMSPFDPSAFSSPVPAATNFKVKLAPNTTYKLSTGELDLCEGCDLDGQTVYPFTQSQGTYLTDGLSFTFSPTSGAGPVLLNAGINSATTSPTLDLYDRVHNIGLDCGNTPYMTGLLNGSSQQGFEAGNIYVRNCLYAVSVQDFSNGKGGAQNHGPFHDIGVTPLNMPTTPTITAFDVTAGGSYSSCPTATVAGCTVNPTPTVMCTGSAVTSVVMTSVLYGSQCSPGSTTVTFSTATGSGAAASPVVQMTPHPIGFRLGGVHSTGGGSYERLWVVGGNFAIDQAEAYTIDNSNEYLKDLLSESNFIAMCIGCHTTSTLGGIKVDGLRASTTNNATQTVVQLGSYTSQVKNLGVELSNFSGGAPDLIIDGQPGGGTIRNRSTFVTPGITKYMRNGNAVFSTDPDQPNTGMTYANLYFNCGTCSASTKTYQFVPVKNVGGYAQSMTTSDTAEPIGIAMQGNFDTTNTHYTAVAFAGEIPCLFDPSVTVTPGDYVTISANTVVTALSIGGCVDAGSTLPTGWNLGRVVAMGTTGSASIPSTPVVTGATLTPSTNNARTYSYVVTAATQNDFTESAPSTTLTTSTGPNTLVPGQITISGLTSGFYNIYRTAMPSSTLPTLTAVCCSNGQVTGISGFPAGTGYSFGPTGSFSGGGCSTEPFLNGPLYVSGGQIVGANFQSFGVGCTSAPTLTLTKSTYETGWIGQIQGTSFTDNGKPGDGSTAPPSGKIVTLVALHPMHN